MSCIENKRLTLYKKIVEIYENLSNEEATCKSGQSGGAPIYEFIKSLKNILSTSCVTGSEIIEPIPDNIIERLKESNKTSATLEDVLYILDVYDILDGDTLEKLSLVNKNWRKYVLKFKYNNLDTNMDKNAYLWYYANFIATKGIQSAIKYNRTIDIYFHKKDINKSQHNVRITYKTYSDYLIKYNIMEYRER